MSPARLRGEAIAAAVVFCLTATVATVLWQVTGNAVTDIPLYRTYGERIADGLVPYRDFGFEYPPAALPALVLPALLTETTTAFRIVFGVERAVVGAVGVLLLAATLRRLGRSDDDRRASLTAVALLPLLLGGVILTRFDLVPATLVAAALLLFLTERRTAGALVLGLAIAAKLYPAVLLPLVAVAAYRRGGSRAAGATVALAAVPVVVCYLPFLVVGLDGVLDSLGRQLGRPLQIESLGAGALLVLHHDAGVSLAWSSSAGSQNLTGAAAGTLAVLLAVAQVAAVALVWVVHARGPMSDERLVRHAAAAVVAFVAFSKVLSPQFLVWLLLLVPLVGGAGSRIALWLLAAACALTALWFPARYWELVREFDPFASFLVLARGVALVALFAALVLERFDPAGAESNRGSPRLRRGGTPEGARVRGRTTSLSVNVGSPATERVRARSRSPVPSPGRT